MNLVDSIAASATLALSIGSGDKMRHTVPGLLSMALVLTTGAVADASSAHPAAKATSACFVPTSFGEAFYGVAATSGKNAWAVGICAGSTSRTLIERWNGKVWKKVPSPNPGGSASRNFLDGVAAVSSASAWAVGQTGTFAAPQTLIARWNGKVWRMVPSPDPGGSAHANNLDGVAAVSSASAWAVGYYFGRAAGQTMILRWNGTAWRTVPSPDPGGLVNNNVLNGVAALSSASAWAVGWFQTSTGSRTLILHWNGKAWKKVPSPNPNAASTAVLSAVAAVSSTSVWAAGFYDSGGVSRTLIEHWNGKAWKLVPSPNTAGVAADDGVGSVAAVSANLAWTGGGSTDSSNQSQTLILRWNGRTWRKVPSPDPGGPAANNAVAAIAVVSPASAWAAGSYSDGTFQRTLALHWNGTTWKRIPSP